MNVGPVHLQFYVLRAWKPSARLARFAAHVSAAFGVPATAAGHRCWLDGWRGLSILMVLIGHFAPSQLGHCAQFGVEMFFVLSGRLMAELLIERRQPLATFVVRRITRILPLLALYVGVVAIGLGVATVGAGTAANWLSPIASLLFFSNYIANPAPLLEHTWSLAVEEHSYLLLVGVAAVATRKPRVAGSIAAVLAGCMILNGVRLFYGGTSGAPYVFWRSDVRGASVLLSFALCLLLRHWRASTGPNGRAWLSPACLLGAALCVVPGDPVSPLQATACTVLAVIAVNTLELSTMRYRCLLSLGVLQRLGLLSFSLYMWQQPFFLATKGGFPVAAALPLTLICAVWSFVRVERPARRYLNRRWAAMWEEARGEG